MDSRLLIMSHLVMLLTGQHKSTKRVSTDITYVGPEILISTATTKEGEWRVVLSVITVSITRDVSGFTKLQRRGVVVPKDHEGWVFHLPSTLCSSPVRECTVWSVLCARRNTCTRAQISYSHFHSLSLHYWQTSESTVLYNITDTIAFKCFTDLRQQFLNQDKTSDTALWPHRKI